MSSPQLIKLMAQPDVMAELYETEDELVDFLAGVEADPLQFFCANGPQERIIEETVHCMQESNTPVVMASCANGIGKTTLATHMIANIIYGPQNGWFDYPEFTSKYWRRKPKTVWYVSTASAISSTIFPMLEKLLKNDIVTRTDREADDAEIEFIAIKEGKSIVSKITLSNGWEIKFKTFEQDLKAYESDNVGIIIIDEPAPEAVWRACLGRRRMGCLMFLPMTPLDCPPYIFDDVKKAYSEKRPGYGYIESSVYEVSMLSGVGRHCGVRGHLLADVIDGMVLDYTEEERDARAFGRSTYFSGRIYPEFSNEKHCVKPENFPITDRMNFLHVVDPHDGRPCACGFAAVDSTGRIIVFEETPVDRKKAFWNMQHVPSLEAETSAWDDVERKHEIDHDRVNRIMDKKMGFQTRGRTTFNELFIDLGYSFGPSYQFSGQVGEIAYGHLKVHEYLKDRPDGFPGIVFWDTLKHIPEGLTHYTKRKAAGVQAQHKSKSDGTIIEKYKDFADVIRYLSVEAYVMDNGDENESQEKKQMRNVLKKLKTPKDEENSSLSGFNRY